MFQVFNSLIFVGKLLITIDKSLFQVFLKHISKCANMLMITNIIYILLNYSSCKYLFKKFILKNSFVVFFFIYKELSLKSFLL